MTGTARARRVFVLVRLVMRLILLKLSRSLACGDEAAINRTLDIFGPSGEDPIADMAGLLLRLFLVETKKNRIFGLETMVELT